MTSTPAAAWRTQFHEQGYVVVPDVLGASEIAHFRTVIDAFLVHGAARNRSARVRRTCFYEFMAADAWPLAGIHGEDLKAVLGPIESRQVLGDAMVTPRLAAVPVRLPLPRPAGGHYGSIYEVQEALPGRYFS